jgi:hypothetical protein
MRTKQQIWEYLSDNPAYKEAIGKVAPEERSKIEDVLRGQYVEVLHRLEEMFSRAATDPRTRDELERALSERKQVVNTESQKTDSIG